MLHCHNIAIARLYLVLCLGLLLLGGGAYLFAIKPLYDRLHAGQVAGMTRHVESSQWLIESVIRRHRDLSRQTASRSALRARQAAYLRGDTSLDALAAFGVPKLSDALRANDEMAGIARYDPAGRLLFSVGEAPPPEAAQRCELARLRAVTLLGPTQIRGKRRLLYCSPIMDRHAGHVGADILVMRDDAIQRIIDVAVIDLSMAMHLAVANGDRILYWPAALYDPAVRRSLETFIATGRMAQEHSIAARSVSATDWTLYAVADGARLRADIRRQRVLLLGATAAMALLLLVLAAAALRPVRRTLLQQQLLHLSSQRDGLTGLYNHAHMEALLDRELSRARRYGHPLSLLMFDIDHFKDINDAHGHLIGDDVLRTVARLVQRNARAQDMAARYGGDEFMVLLPETDSAAAASAAERLREAVAAARIAGTHGTFGVTISVGLVSAGAAAGAVTRRHLVAAADQALYKSKAGGRNRVSRLTLPA